MGQVAVALSVSATARSLFCIFTEPKGLERSRTQWSRRLPCRITLATYLISTFQLALALPDNPRANLSSQAKYATCITILAWWGRYAIYLLHFPLLPHDARTSGPLHNSTFLFDDDFHEMYFLSSWSVDTVIILGCWKCGNYRPATPDPKFYIVKGAWYRLLVKYFSPSDPKKVGRYARIFLQPGVQGGVIQ